MRIVLESIEEVNEFIQNWNSVDKVSTTIKEEITDEKPKTIRHYSDTIIRQAPIIVDIDKKTHKVISDKGKKLECTIFELVKLRELISKTKEYPNHNAIAKKMKWGLTRTAYTCASIELGLSDIVLNKWDNAFPKYDEFGQVM